MDIKQIYQDFNNEFDIKCNECGNTHILKDNERGELICSQCGLVLESRLMDQGPEWRAFDFEQKEKRVRVGAPMTYTIHDKGLSTMIDWRNQDYAGKNLRGKNRAQIYRLRKWNRRMRVSDATERNLALAFSELDRMSSHLGIPKNVKEVAAFIYRKAVEKRLVRGRSIEEVASAALYAALRQCRTPRTLDEIAEIAKANKKEIGRSYRFIINKLNIQIPNVNPVNYITRISQDLQLSIKVQLKAIEILKKATEIGLTSGRGPCGVAAAAVYIASVLLNEKKTQTRVAKVARVTEVTVRNRYKEICSELNLDVSL
ncbi:MAG: transcription initiation factor IIB [Candidatus Helarchaeota archaeon]